MAIGKRHRDTGVELFWSVSQDAYRGMHESYYKDLRQNLKYETLAENQRERTAAAIFNGVGKYPRRIVKQNLTRIFAVGEYAAGGRSAGGHAHYDNFGQKYREPWKGSAVVVVINNFKSDGNIEGTFHHELAHLLLSKYRWGCHVLAGEPVRYFEQESWRAINPPDFKYWGTGAKFNRDEPEPMPEIASSLNSRVKPRREPLSPMPRIGRISGDFLVVQSTAV